MQQTLGLLQYAWAEDESDSDKSANVHMRVLESIVEVPCGEYLQIRRKHAMSFEAHRLLHLQDATDACAHPRRLRDTQTDKTEKFTILDAVAKSGCIRYVALS